MKLLGKSAGHILWEILGPVNGRNRWSDGFNAIAVVPAIDFYINAPAGVAIDVYENTTPVTYTGINVGPVTQPKHDRITGQNAVVAGAVGPNGTLDVAGDFTDRYLPGTQVSYAGDTGDVTANANYTVVSSAFAAGVTTITVNGAIGTVAPAFDGIVSGPTETATSPRPISFGEGQRPDPAGWGISVLNIVSGGAPAGPVSYAPTIGTVLAPTWLRVVLTTPIPAGVNTEGYVRMATKWS